MPEEFKHAALYLRLGLPSTLIRHENRESFENVLKPEEFENSSFVISRGRTNEQHFESRAFQKW